MADINERVKQLESKLNAVIDIVSNKPQLSIDAKKIEDFIEKYSIVNELLNNDTLTSTVNKLNELNEMIDNIKKETEAPLLVAQTQSQKIMSMYSSDDVSLSLNIADVKRFKGEIYTSLRDFIDYLKKLNIDAKVKELDSELEIAKKLANDVVAMRDKLKKMSDKIAAEEEALKKIQEVNKEQDLQITYVNNLIITLEKEIESYAFFTNEFNKIYLNAKEFIVRFAEALETLEYIEKRDEALYQLVNKLLAAFTTDYSSLESAIYELKDRITSFTNEMLEWLNHSLLFTNEVKAYNLSLNAYNSDMKEIQEKCASINNKLANISINV